jgi:hypothetical protein
MEIRPGGLAFFRPVLLSLNEVRGTVKRADARAYHAVFIRLQKKGGM